MSRTPLLVGAAVLALPLLSADPASLGHDLTPKFSEGQELTITQEMVLSFGLDDATAQMGEMEMIPEVPTVDMEMEMSGEMTESVLSVRDGKLAKLRRTHVEESMSMTGEAGMQGQFQDFDESQDGPLQGRTIELTLGEDGWEAEDVTEDGGSLDETGEAMLAMANEKTHMEYLLPSRPVEVGGTWDVGDEMLEAMTTAMAATSEDDSETAAMMDMLGGLKDSVDFDAKGKLVSVDDGIAQIEWKMTAELAIDDIFSMVREVMDPDMMGELPESAEGSLEMAMEMTGTGTFDLSVHQLTEANFEGEFALAAEMAMSEQGMEIEASADASGTMEMAQTISVE